MQLTMFGKFLVKDETELIKEMKKTFILACEKYPSKKEFSEMQKQIEKKRKQLIQDNKNYDLEIAANNLNLFDKMFPTEKKEQTAKKEPKKVVKKEVKK